jgi:hypothetical protein
MYSLFNRILDGKPTLFRMKGGRLVGFKEDGFHIHSINDPQLSPNFKYPPNTWALADVANAVSGTEGEPNGPLEADKTLFVVFVTSPNLKGKAYKQWLKDTGATRLIMGPMYKEEMRAFRYETCEPELMRLSTVYLRSLWKPFYSIYFPLLLFSTSLL